MIHLNQITFTLTAVLLTATFATAQTYVNKEWVKNHGAPDTIEWSASTTDMWEQLITTGNTLVSGQYANILVTKFDEAGNISWQQDWNGNKGKSDYGAAVITDNSGNIYVAGASHYSNDSIFDIVLLKYDWQGNLQWAVNYDGTGGADYPVEMAKDLNGNIYITGASEGNNSDLDFITLKYDNNGNLQWASRYDYTQNVDIAADIVTEGGGDQVTVTGGSEDTAGVWDYTTVSYDINGNQISVDREPSDETDIKKPKDIVKDGNKNYYITGIKNNGADNDIKLIKLDSTLQSQWVQIYNHDNEGSNALSIDNNGNLYIGGWQEKGPGTRYFLLLKYDNNGSLQWKQTLWPDDEKPIAEITDIQIENNELINVIGFTTDGYNSDIVTAQFNTEGDLHWTRTWENFGGSMDYPSSIEQVGDDVYVSGRTNDTAGVKWVVIKYSFYDRDTSLVYDPQGNPAFAKNELLVRFDPSVVKTDAVDNAGTKEAEFGDLNYYLKQTAVDDIQEKLSGLCVSSLAGEGDCPITMLKIFKQLKSTDNYTTSRLGEQIPIPPFWATFVLAFPEGSDISQIADSLNALFPMVKYAHANVVATTTANANDSLYPDQASLGHINVEPAWNFAQGKTFVKAGIFDTGLDWEHEDFGYDGSNPASSKIVDGWNFQTNAPLKSGNGDPQGHGTKCGGILGAIRNNQIGVAGVAGGNDSVSNTGVSMYGFRIIDPPFSSTFNYIADAIIGSAIDDSTTDYGFGLHISSNSWRIHEFHTQPPSQWFTDANITLLREAVHFANRAKVTFAAARGNEGYANQSYPAILDDDWVLCVGGTGTDGEYIKAGQNGGFSASTGWEIDVAAPAASAIVRTLNTGGGYGNFNGTSAATPHVAGLAGLLMSYLNAPTPSYDNLAPEDVEYIIQMTATDVNTTGVDSLTGFGRINAGAAMAAVDKSSRKLKHYGTDAFSNNISVSLYSTNTTITIPERYENADSVWFNTGKYLVNTYKVDATVYHNLASTDTLVASWPRPSSSNVLPLYNTNNELLPRERVVLNSVNQNSASLTGYIYRVSDTLGNFLGWWPFDTTSTNPQFAYSLLLQNANYTNVEELVYGQANVKVYPNPASGQQLLVLDTERPENLSIHLFDISGRTVQHVYTGRSAVGEQSFNVNLDGLVPGIYIYRIGIGEDVQHLKVIKN